MDILYYLLGFLFGLVSVVMVLLILIQKGRGGGLSSAFGGAGGNTAFGSKTGDVLTWVTACVFGVFLLLAMMMIWTSDVLYARATQIGEQTSLDAAITDPEEQAPPAPTGTPSPENLDGGGHEALQSGIGTPSETVIDPEVQATEQAAEDAADLGVE